MDKILQDVEKQLLNFAPYIEGIIAQSAGRYGLIQVLLKEEYRTSDIPYILYERLVTYEGNLGGVGMSVYGKGLEGIGKPLSGSRNVSNRLSIHGFNFGQVNDIAEDIAEQLRQRRSRRIKDIYLDFAYGPSQHEIVAQFDHGKTSPLGLDHADIVHEIQGRLATGGTSAHLYVDGRQYTVSVADTGASRMTARHLSQVALEPHPVRIGHVAHIEKRVVTPSIKREDQRYIRTIGFTVLGSHSYSNSILQDIVDHTPLPYGYSLSNPMIYEIDKKEQRELGSIVLLAILLVWMIAAALFESWTQPLLVLIALPLALIGMGAALFLFDAPFNQGGYAALLLLMGIAVNNSILLVYTISNALKRQPADPTEAIANAAFQRLRPIFITTLTTIAGFLPLLLQGDRNDFWYTLALGTSGGLASSSVLLVLVVPLCAIWRIRVRLNTSSL
jgi:multidrug efflux pump subunit AcrB